MPSLKNVSYRITSAVTTGSGDDGVIVKQGCRFAGWSLFVADGRAHFAYNYVGLETTLLRGGALSAGAHEIAVVFDYDGGGLGKGGTFRLLVDDVEVDLARVERTVPFFFSHDSTLDVGIDRNAPVTTYPRGRGFAFTGAIEHVTISVGDDAVPGAAARRARRRPGGPVTDVRRHRAAALAWAGAVTASALVLAEQYAELPAAAVAFAAAAWVLRRLPDRPTHDGGESSGAHAG